MYETKISIIVPVYNAGRFISTCIQSVLNQTFLDWELILVDDGSTDDSLVICEHFADKDERIKVVHQENRGVSAARNLGLLNAKGAYVEFIDADDTIDAEYMESLYQGVVLFDADVCIGNASIIRSDNGKTLSICQNEIHTGFFTLNEFLQYYPQYMSYCLLGPVWNKLYKRSILLEHSIIFNQNIKNNEDTHFNYEYLARCNSVYVSNCPYYNYINRKEYASASKKNIVDLFNIYSVTYDKAILFLKETNMYDQHVQFQNTYYINLVIGAMSRIINSENKYSRSEKLQELRKICNNKRVCNAVQTVELTEVKKKIVVHFMKKKYCYLLYYIFSCKKFIKRFF